MFGGQFSPSTSGSRDGTRVVGLVWQRLLPSEPLHWPQAHFKKRIRVWGADVIYAVKAENGCILGTER